MAVVKVIKTKAYFKRFQVKKRRRRSNKTDFAARTRLCKQDKSKYNSKKYRLVVRFTNSRIICSVNYATISGDIVMCAADSTELTRYGVPCGLKNYAAAYATGLLCARRLLNKLKLDSQFVGVKKADGKEFHITDEDSEQNPFRCVLDIGLVNSTVGHRVYGALKGAVDGGLNIPHNTKKFAGYDDETKKYDPEAHSARIYGEHVADYMKTLSEDDDEKFKAHFAKYLKAGMTHDKIKSLYAKCHEAIRANPAAIAKKVHSGINNKRVDNTTIKTAGGKSYNRPKKITLEERKERVWAKIQAFQEKSMAEMED